MPEAKTPDAGKAGKVLIKVWPSATAPGVNNPTTTTDPATVKLATGQLITVGFVPIGTQLPKPSADHHHHHAAVHLRGRDTTTTTTLP